MTTQPNAALQAQSFATAWTPAAKKAAAQLGVPYQWVLAQWAMETANGTQGNMGVNNPGNVLTASGAPKSFASPAAFLSEYVASVKNDFPHLTGAKSPQQAFNGAQSYDPGVTNYGQRVASRLQSLTSLGAFSPSAAPTLLGGPGQSSSAAALLAYDRAHATGLPTTVLGDVTGTNPQSESSSGTGFSWSSIFGTPAGTLSLPARIGYFVGGVVAVIMGVVLLVVSDKEVKL